jgi:hypothetical protein
MIELFPGQAANKYTDQIKKATRISVSNVSNVNTGILPHSEVSQN